MEGSAKDLLGGFEAKEVEPSLASRYSPWRFCARVKAVNWTPWWGGRYDQTVRDPITCEPLSKPTSDTIKGVLRWVIRVALASRVSADYRDLEQIIAIVYGGARRKRGSIEHFDSLVRVSVDSKVENDASETCSKEKVRRLQNIPRLKLLQLGRRDIKSFLRFLPVAPGKVKVDIEIDVKEVALRTLGINVGDVCSLSLYALSYALMVKGIGRGSTRGFGRFRLENVEMNSIYKDKSTDAAKEISELANLLSKEDSSRDEVREAIKEFHKKLINLAGAVFGRFIKNKASKPSSLVPSLANTEIRVVDDAKYFAGGPRAVRDVYDALIAIGKSTLKISWKRVAGVNLSEPGTAFHTWILGLPRWQRYTGYFIYDKKLGNNVCVKMFEEQNGKRELLKVDPGRRSSPIILFPSPGKPSRIIVLAYKTKDDHMEILKNLYHSGRHCKPQRDTGCRHVVKVSHIITSPRDRIGRPSSGDCVEDVCCGWGGSTGIERPSTRGSRQGNPSVVNIDEVYDAALDFIVECLKRGC